MNYYGFVYGGRNASYIFDGLSLSFDNPFDALKHANEKWNANPDYQIARLLVVVVLDKLNNNSSSLKYAFFQFTDSTACEQFVSKQNNIIWSENGDQIWNGNAHMM